MLRLHLFGELLNDFGILNIAALSGNRHQQMLAHQPHDQLRFAGVQTVQFSEFEYVLSAKYRVIAAASFGDIVEQRGNQNQFRLSQAWPQIHTKRVALAGVFIGETFQLEHYADGVLIHRIGMKQVKLHLADNMRPLRHISPQHAVAMHWQQAATHRARMA